MFYMIIYIMNTITITKRNFIKMIPQMYKFVDSYPEVVLMPKKSVDMSAYKYVVSWKASKKSENDAVIKNRTQLKKYLSHLK